MQPFVRSLLAKPLLTTVLGAVVWLLLGTMATAQTAKTHPSATKSLGPKATSTLKKNTAAKKNKTVSGKAFGNTKAVRELALQIARQHQLPVPWVTQQIASARQLSSILPMVLPPTSPQQKNWTAYRARFLTDSRIESGVKFWRENALPLELAAQTFGVPPEYVVGILGVETFYGQHQGAHNTRDALATLSLQFPSAHPQAAERQAYFQNELGVYLKQSKARPKASPALGSYAGASGMPQFMPSSIERFAIDFDGKGHIDLAHSAADAIGSVANYFKAYGWRPGMPTHFEIDVSAVSEDELNAFLAPDIVPTWTVSHLQSKHAKLSDTAQSFDQPLALVQLHNGGNPATFVAGTENFFVITRYNRSSYYALAVIELGEAVKERMKALACRSKRCAAEVVTSMPLSTNTNGVPSTAACRPQMLARVARSV